MNCRVDRSDPDAAVAPRRYGLDPLLPTPGHHSMSGSLIRVRIRNSSSNSSQNGRYGKEQEENKAMLKN
nr:ATPase, F0 complex, subunit C, mitochondrion, mitochondrial [Tanacetum cinerariifolium]